jgi:hypothetical protein
MMTLTREWVLFIGAVTLLMIGAVLFVVTAWKNKDDSRLSDEWQVVLMVSMIFGLVGGFGTFFSFIELANTLPSGIQSEVRQ